MSSYDQEFGKNKTLFTERLTDGWMPLSSIFSIIGYIIASSNATIIMKGTALTTTTTTTTTLWNGVQRDHRRHHLTFSRAF